MIFDYSALSVFTKSIDVDDIGNTAIRATSDEGLQYYMVIKTVMGITSILKFGAIVPDIQALVNNFSVLYQKIDYKEKLIQKSILQFINDPKKRITDVEEVSVKEALEAFPNVSNSFEYYGEE